MRLVEILIPKQKRHAVEATLDEEGIDYTVLEEASREEPSIVVLSAVLGAVTYDTYRTGAYEEELNRDVAAVLDSPEYDELSLVDVSIEYSDPVPPRQPDRVVVRVGYPIGTDPPPVADAIRRRGNLRAELAIPLPTGPIVDSQRAEVVVRYVAQDQ